MIYDVNYFIDKFQKISASLWIVGAFGQQDFHCALGHCGARCSSDVVPLSEASILVGIMRKHLNSFPSIINDGLNSNYPQHTPKQRILAALQDIKKMQDKSDAPPREDITHELAKDSVEERLNVKQIPLTV